MFVAPTGAGIPARATADGRASVSPKKAHPCRAMRKPPTSSSVATRIYSRFRTTKLEELFLGAAARVDGYSGKSFSWAPKIRWPLRSSRNQSSAASQPRATTSGVTLAGRKEQLTGYEPQVYAIQDRYFPSLGWTLLVAPAPPTIRPRDDLDPPAHRPSA